MRADYFASWMKDSPVIFGARDAVHVACRGAGSLLLCGCMVRYALRIV